MTIIFRGKKFYLSGDFDCGIHQPFIDSRKNPLIFINNDWQSWSHCVERDSQGSCRVWFPKTGQV